MDKEVDDILSGESDNDSSSSDDFDGHGGGGGGDNTRGGRAKSDYNNCTENTLASEIIYF